VTYFLDTDICIFALRGDHPGLVDEFRSRKPGTIKVPAIVAAELMLGAKKSSNTTAQKAVAALLEPLEIAPFDEHAAEVYAAIRDELEKKGTLIGPNDLIIAATAASRRGTLVTHNVREFKRVPGLKVQDWIK
jgi:tRNA(fMet)-specific endonuclease VapC